MNLENLEEINDQLLLWYQKNARDLPWRNNPTPYYVWISEIMLQQTRVEAVKEYYLRFIKKVPTIKALSQVEDDVLLKLWEGLGYYSRARNLKKSAILLMERFNGELPQAYDDLLKLPGIGEYTAGAISSIAYGQAVSAIDGNVLRVITRLCGIKTEISNLKLKKEIRVAIQNAMPKLGARDYNQALMELGATICIPNGNPLCDQCPLLLLCEARIKGLTHVIPAKTKKKNRKIEEHTVLLITYENFVLVSKRNEKGILAGMWEFPNLLGWLSENEVEQYLSSFDYQIKKINKIETAKHIFTHIEWHMIGYHIVLSHLTKTDTFQLKTKEMLQKDIAVPSAFRTYTEYFFNL